MPEPAGPEQQSPIRNLVDLGAVIAPGPLSITHVQSALVGPIPTVLGAQDLDMMVPRPQFATYLLSRDESPVIQRRHAGNEGSGARIV